MIYKISVSTIFLFFFSISFLQAQEEVKKTPNPRFEKFTGTVYSMPIITKTKGRLKSKSLQEYYDENIYDYIEIGTIELALINVPETIITEGKFPGVDKRTQFSMILNSKMKIYENGCYEFSLNSDDGSILWVEGVEIVNNDGGHKMKMKKDSIYFNKGVYDIKLWYFQGLADRFGLEMNSKSIDDLEECKIFKKEVNFQSNLLFDSGEYLLKDKAIQELNNLIISTKSRRINSIEIIGHTDNVGSPEKNLILSQNRANAIFQKLKVLTANEDIEFISIGKGEIEPISPNLTEEGRKENRRVHIIIK